MPASRDARHSRGQPYSTEGSAELPQESNFERELCADMQGFSLHATVSCETDDREGLERLCGYIARPALAYERVRCTRRVGWC